MKTRPRRSMVLIKKACLSYILMVITFLTAGALLTKCQRAVLSTASSDSYTRIPNHSASGLPRFMKRSSLSKSSTTVAGIAFRKVGILKYFCATRFAASVPRSGRLANICMRHNTALQTMIVLILFQRHHCLPLSCMRQVLQPWRQRTRTQ